MAIWNPDGEYCLVLEAPLAVYRSRFQDPLSNYGERTEDRRSGTLELRVCEKLDSKRCTCSFHRDRVEHIQERYTDAYDLLKDASSPDLCALKAQILVRSVFAVFTNYY